MAQRHQNERHPVLGITTALVSAAAFGTSGAFAKPLLLAGWSPGLVVALRITVAAAVLAVPTLLALRGRWSIVRGHVGIIVLYGAAAVAGCQVAYFNAVTHLSVGVALLLEYLAPTLIVLWLWARTRRAPRRRTAMGAGISLVGLALVLDLTGGGAAIGSPVGVLWGLVAAVGLVLYFLIADRIPEQFPPIALAGLGLFVGSVLLWLAGLVGAIDLERGVDLVSVAGRDVPWWANLLVIAIVAGSFAYVMGIGAVRMLRAKLAAFIALTEVLFAVLFAWLVLGEMPTSIQVLGGALVLVGVVAVRADETDPEPIDSAAAGEPVTAPGHSRARASL